MRMQQRHAAIMQRHVDKLAEARRSRSCSAIRMAIAEQAGGDIDERDAEPGRAGVSVPLIDISPTIAWSTAS